LNFRLDLLAHISSDTSMLSTRSGVGIRNYSSIRSCKPNATSVHYSSETLLREEYDHLARFSLSTVLTSVLEGLDEDSSSTYGLRPVKFSQGSASLCFQNINVISEHLYFGVAHYFSRSSEHPMVVWLSDRIVALFICNKTFDFIL
jgi:hypothetical protein